MPYIDLAGLSRYASRQKERLERDCALLRDMQWTRSEKAGAVSLWPAGGMSLDVSVDFLFTEVPPASGDKGPTNPSTITGVSEVNLWLAGKNINRVLPYYNFTDGVQVINGVTFTANADGSVTANGLADGNANCSLYNSNNIHTYGEPIGVGVWTVSGCPSGSNYTYSLQTVVSTGYGSSSGYEFGSGSTATITKPGAKIGIIIRIPSGYNAQNLVFKPQIELGSEKTSYEQSVEKQKYTISLGSTYYGGTLDVATGVMTVTKIGISISSVNAADPINQFSEAVFRVWPDYWGGEDILNDGAAVSDTLPYSSTVNTGERFFVGAEAGGRHPIYIVINSSRLDFSSAVDPSNPTAVEVRDAGRAFLTAHPMFVVATLETPQTVQLTPTEILSLTQADKYTPRLNTIYTDAQAVQVGYIKSPIRDEYELTQAIAAQGGNV